MQRPAKKHHYVPRSLLKYFRPPSGEDYLFVFDKLKGRAFRTSLMNAGSENDFNSFRQGNVVEDFEADFDELDARLANRLEGLHQARNIPSQDSKLKHDWADLVAVQLARTPIIRSTIGNVIADLKRSIEDGLKTNIAMPIPSDNDARVASRAMVLRREAAVAALARKDMVLFKASDAATFRISDRPVVMQSALPYGDTGLNSPGVTVFMPLGQDLLLGLLCPSIRVRLNKYRIEDLDLPAEKAKPLLALKNGLNTGELVGWEDTAVASWNVSQIAACSRFVYGPSNSFSDVEDVLQRYPEARSTTSAISVGEMGKGPGRSPYMPMGNWLVLFGRTSQHMLEIYEAHQARGGLEAHVVSPALLQEALADRPFSEMRLFRDQYEREVMRDVRVDLIEGVPSHRIRVAHSNEALASLFATLDRHGT